MNVSDWAEQLFLDQSTPIDEGGDPSCSPGGEDGSAQQQSPGF